MWLDPVSLALCPPPSPSGQMPLTTRLEEVRLAVKDGAREIDIVINRTLALEHKWEEMFK